MARCLDMDMTGDLDDVKGPAKARRRDVAKARSREVPEVGYSARSRYVLVLMFLQFNLDNGSYTIEFMSIPLAVFTYSKVCTTFPIW